MFDYLNLGGAGVKYWQLSAGDTGRDYSDVLLKFGVALVGPGRHGPFHEGNKKYAKEGDVRRFARDLQPGHIVILKRPEGRNWAILAVGTVDGDYQHLKVFGDVDGWDLEHARRVSWRWSQKPIVSPGLSRGTFKRVRSEEPKELARQVLETGQRFQPEYAIPEKALDPLEDETLIGELINFGLRPGDAEELSTTIKRIRLLANWYWKHGDDVLEHETRTFLVIPLLLALGWSEQRLKIEWGKRGRGRVDVAFFREPYTGGEKDNPCIMLMETKKLGVGLTPGQKQAQRYAEQFPEASRLLVSNGYVYKLYSKKADSWDFQAYLNLLNPLPRHPFLPHVGGAVHVFQELMT